MPTSTFLLALSIQGIGTFDFQPLSR